MLRHYDSPSSSSSSSADSGSDESESERKRPLKRIRTIEHVEGNFPSYVYIKVPRNDDWDIARHHCAASFAEPLDGSRDELHVSLTPLILLRHHFIGPFVEKLRAKVEHVSAFDCYFEDVIDVYVNEEKTRYFAGVPASEVSVGPLTKLHDAANKVRSSFPCDGMARPKGPYRFHVSLASSLQPSTLASGEDSASATAWPEVASLPALNLSAEVGGIFVRAGKRDYFIDLRKP
eukprot:GEMP01071102.1.p1 GENE.GEMP01071102.1~~GEMP01071102.1.p1  ORF type:complete len:233 (+),score=50.42 GEMP01071102.1:135-833(+)